MKTADLEKMIGSAALVAVVPARFSVGDEYALRAAVAAEVLAVRQPRKAGGWKGSVKTVKTDGVRVRFVDNGSTDIVRSARVVAEWSEHEKWIVANNARREQQQNARAAAAARAKQNREIAEAAVSDLRRLGFASAEMQLDQYTGVTFVAMSPQDATRIANAIDNRKEQA